jgi:hypothetical protein
MNFPTLLEYLRTASGIAEPKDQKSAFDIVRDYLNSKKFVFEADEQTRVFRLPMTCPNCTCRLAIALPPGTSRVLVYAWPSTMIPESARALVCEYLTRANFGLQIGNFEFNSASGELRFKTSMDFSGQELTAGNVHHLIGVNVNSVDRYFPGLMKVAFAGVSVQCAVEGIERPVRNASI